MNAPVLAPDFCQVAWVVTPDRPTRPPVVYHFNP